MKFTLFFLFCFAAVPGVHFFSFFTYFESSKRLFLQFFLFGGCFAQPPSIRGSLFLSRNDEDDDKQPHYYFITLYVFAEILPRHGNNFTRFYNFFRSHSSNPPVLLHSACEDVFSRFSPVKDAENGGDREQRSVIRIPNVHGSQIFNRLEMGHRELSHIGLHITRPRKEPNASNSNKCTARRVLHKVPIIRLAYQLGQKNGGNVRIFTPTTGIVEELDVKEVLECNFAFRMNK